MRKLPIYIAILALLVIAALIVNIRGNGPGGPLPPGDGKNTAPGTTTEIAENWIKKKAWTYIFDGSKLTHQSTVTTTCPACYQVTFTFESAHGGYGDRRADTVLTQVITPHTIVVDIENGQVTSAITDGVFDEVGQELLETETMTVRVFFPNTTLDPEVSCNKVFPVERAIPRTAAPARKALEALLTGPTAEEKSRGFVTSLPEGVVVQRLAIENGVAWADFNEKLDEGVGGSCWVISIRTQIAETLKQFPTVQSAVVSIDGRTDDILQP